MTTPPRDEVKRMKRYKFQLGTTVNKVGLDIQLKDDVREFVLASDMDAAIHQAVAAQAAKTWEEAILACAILTLEVGGRLPFEKIEQQFKARAQAIRSAGGQP